MQSYFLNGKLLFHFSSLLFHSSIKIKGKLCLVCFAISKPEQHSEYMDCVAFDLMSNCTEALNIYYSYDFNFFSFCILFCFSYFRLAIHYLVHRNHTIISFPTNKLTFVLKIEMNNRSPFYQNLEITLNWRKCSIMNFTHVLSITIVPNYYSRHEKLLKFPMILNFFEQVFLIHLQKFQLMAPVKCTPLIHLRHQLTPNGTHIMIYIWAVVMASRYPFGIIGKFTRNKAVDS